jgi:chromosome segregation ATPase
MAAISAAATAAYANNNQKPPRTIEECEAKVQALKQNIIDLTKKQVCDVKTIDSLRKNQADLLDQTDKLNAQIHTIHKEYSQVLNQNGVPNEVVERQTQNMNELLERTDEFLDSFHRVNASMAAKSTDLREELGQFIAKLEALHVNVPQQLKAIEEKLDANPAPDINEVRDAVTASIAAANQSQEAMIQELNASIEELRTNIGEDKTSDLAIQVTKLTELVKTQAKTITDIKKIQDECFGAGGTSENHVPTSFAQISAQLDELTKAIKENMNRSSTDSNTKIDALIKEIAELKTRVGSGPGSKPQQEPGDEVVVDMNGARTFVSQQNSITTGDLDHMATINGNIYFFTHKPTGKLYKYATAASKPK